MTDSLRQVTSFSSHPKPAYKITGSGQIGCRKPAVLLQKKIFHDKGFSRLGISSAFFRSQLAISVCLSCPPFIRLARIVSSWYPPRGSAMRTNLLHQAQTGYALEEYIEIWCGENRRKCLGCVCAQFFTQLSCQWMPFRTFESSWLQIISCVWGAKFRFHVGEGCVCVCAHSTARFASDCFIRNTASLSTKIFEIIVLLSCSVTSSAFHLKCLWQCALKQTPSWSEANLFLLFQ